MDYLNNIIEYYDELYPITESQKKLFTDLIQQKMPAHILRIGCSTGLFEHYLARLGHDVTGIDTSKEMLESANRRRRMPNTAIRFFQMSSIEMTRFLGKGFYDVISCINDKLLFVRDRTLMRKFFYDCRQLLSATGTLVVQVPYFKQLPDADTVPLPVRENIRVKLTTSLTRRDDTWYMQQSLEHAGFRQVPVLRDAEVYPVTVQDLKEFAREAGFTRIELYGGYDLSPLSDDSSSVIAILQ
ncbi:MAG: class I SAM-dependent methyltransferase [Treponemataceae bacterium]|nr:class I SAM-dependent methyltransferase [Treponemataceae bacterium]